MAKFTLADFERLYPSNDACIDRLFQLRYGSLKTCPECGKPASFKRIPTRQCYHCTLCCAQFYPLAGTPMEKSRVPLSRWLFIIYQFITTRNGLAAKEIQRQLGVTYKCAWRMGHQIRRLIATSDESVIMGGIVELDEAVVGGKSKNMHAKRRKKMKEETGSISNKTVVFGMLERGVGVRVHVIPTHAVEGKDLHPIIREQIDTSATLMTDKSKAYDALEGEYTRESVNHSYGQYVRGDNIHVNGLEGFWAQLKRMISGTHIQVSRKYLPLYAAEAVFRYNNVFKGERMFDSVLAKLPVVKERTDTSKGK